MKMNHGKWELRKSCFCVEQSFFLIWHRTSCDVTIVQPHIEMLRLTQYAEPEIILYICDLFVKDYIFIGIK